VKVTKNAVVLNGITKAEEHHDFLVLDASICLMASVTQVDQSKALIDNIKILCASQETKSQFLTLRPQDLIQQDPQPQVLQLQDQQFLDLQTHHQPHHQPHHQQHALLNPDAEESK